MQRQFLKRIIWLKSIDTIRLWYDHNSKDCITVYFRTVTNKMESYPQIQHDAAESDVRTRASGAGWTLVGVFLCEILCGFHELLFVLDIFFRQFSTQWMLGFRFMHESHQRLNNWWQKWQVYVWEPPMTAQMMTEVTQSLEASVAAQQG